MTTETSNARGEWVLVPANETTAFAGRLIHTIELPDGFALSGEALVDGIVRLVARDGQPAGKVALRASPQPPAEAQAQARGVQAGEVETRADADTPARRWLAAREAEATQDWQDGFNVAHGYFAAQQPEARGVVGELVEVGDDESGQPRLLIHTTRDAIRAANLIPFSQVEVRNG